MGCINSKTDISEINPNIYRVVNVDANGDELWNGHLEISPKELVLYRKGREPTKWSLQHLRRYGFESDIFTFEAGRRCPTGEGIFAFRCRRAEDLFNVMQNYIQGIAFNDDINQQLSDMTLSPSSTGNNIMGLNGSNSTLVNRFNRQMMTTTTTTTAATSNSRSNNSIQNHNLNTATNYLIPSNRQTTTSQSPNGGINFVNVNRRNDTFANDSSSNYLEPTPMRNNTSTTGARYSSGGIRLSSVGSGPISPEPNSPGSPNSFTIILEVTQLNQSSQNHHQNYANSNIYHEFPFKSGESNNNNNNNNSLNNKLSLDIPPQEPAPAIQIAQQTSNTVMMSNVMNSIDDVQQIQSGNIVCSPIENDSSSRMYVNVTPGEMDNIIRNAGTPTTATSKQMNFAFPRLSSTHSIDLSTRCYENLELSESSSSATTAITTTRYSKPDIFAKVDLPLIGEHSLKTATTTSSTINTTGDKSEPTTPVTNEDDRKVNYIVLDLDSSPSSVTSTSTSTVNNISTVTSASVGSTKSASTTGSVGLVSSNSDSVVCGNNNNDNSNNSINVTNSSSNNNNGSFCSNQIKSTIVSSVSSSSSSAAIVTQQQQQQSSSNVTNYLPLENSENSTTLGYATIDFNKTVALSNSTLPSVELDNDEGVRKTRHSSTATRQSNSISD